MRRSRLSRRSNSEPALHSRKVKKARRSKTPDPKSTARRTSECSSSLVPKLRPRWEKYKIEADFDPIRLFYIGVWTREQVEDRYLRPVLFRLYHRYPSKLKKYNDLTHRLRLYVVYVTSRKEHRIADTQKQFCVKLPKEDAPYFNSLDALVRYYATNCCFQFGPGVEAVPDIFPWWTEDPAARDAKKAARKAARLTAKKITTKKSKSSTN
ncbi:hypothetical protein M3Y99_00869100 [Aphelenchoides fujianensis]|nr:hypothetical protein M3Y99_00869100 [Aphelenchoides fujianensis]